MPKAPWSSQDIVSFNGVSGLHLSSSWSEWRDQRFRQYFSRTCINGDSGATADGLQISHSLQPVTQPWSENKEMFKKDVKKALEKCVHRM